MTRTSSPAAREAPSRVLVAGAGGLGAACVRRFASDGARVAVADVDAARARAVAADSGDHGVSIDVDLTRPEACERAVQEAVSGLGGLDVVVHAAGVNQRQAVVDVDLDAWRQIMQVNLEGAFWLARHAATAMRGERAGAVTFISSMAATIARTRHGVYAASKAALEQLMRVMAAEWAADGIRVNAVAPGYVETDLTRSFLAEPGRRESLRARIPLGRLATPDDVADAVLFLSGPRSAFVTGHTLHLDGGERLCGSSP